jgi:hypothetical protein
MMVGRRRLIGIVISTRILASAIYSGKLSLFLNDLLAPLGNPFE